MTLDDRLLDLSHYDHATFDPACLYASGVRRVILGTTIPSVTAAQIQGCRAAGIEVVALYGLPYYGGGHYVTRDVNNAVALRGFGVPWFAIDAEIDAVDVPDFSRLGFSSPSVAQRRAETIQVRRIAEAAGYGCIMYTGEYWWTGAMDNTRVHADLPLWLANYGTNDPRRPRPPIHSAGFGGWDTVTIHQYSSTIPLCGRERDHNYLLQALPGEDEEDEMTPDQLRLLVTLGEMVVGARDSSNVVGDLADRVSAAARDASLLERDASLNKALLEIRANLQAHIASHQTAGDHTHADIERLLSAANAFAGALDQG